MKPRELVQHLWSRHAVRPAFFGLAGLFLLILLDDVLQRLQRRRPQLGQHLPARVGTTAAIHCRELNGSAGGSRGRVFDLKLS
jgi:hypothetical protein